MNNEISIFDVLSQIVQHCYITEYIIERDTLEEIKTINEPVVKRLAININKYSKAIAHERTCLVCGMSASIFGFTRFEDVRDGSILRVAFFLCKKHYKKLKSQNNNKFNNKINSLILANNFNTPSKSVIYSRKQYDDVEELSFSIRKDELKSFAISKNWNGYMISDEIAERILYSNSKRSLLMFYTGFDEFGTSIRYIKHTPDEEVSFGSPGYWEITNLFTFDDHGLYKYLNPLFTLDKIEEVYWEWVMDDINQRNGSFIDINDKIKFNRFMTQRRIER
ncbi:MAG TPA: hypothetical protein VLX29_09885 [Nitrospirota bacterium]|nr:hypothetical protein [Nitrospirota bacterium]